MKRTLIGVAIAVAALAQTEFKLPEGEGKAALEKVCSKCHEVETIALARHDKEGWGKVVDEMIGRGAEGTDQEFDQIVDYLARTFPIKVAINKSSADDLIRTLVIPKEMAAALVAYREKNGPYKNWDALTKVPGIDLKTLERKRYLIDY